ncbi:MULTISPECIES: hypothetical protein [Bacillus]|uniref:hypothetical protein n=1 Tax=Bacillus cereus group TaxID=86661 RepID=UPI0005E0206C|nr:MULTISPECIES: hypothetical protein [Bacillus cereus group]WIV94106.1 hypothetical protein QNH49_06190 [Bacillus bombysepticus]CEY76975.1 Uncharacterised protein [Streptococcus pneumoniae]MCC2457987.1 hypothetical protein [Bacillus cereus]MCU5672018.1 hypothetical protein [Bacillus cereus]MDA2088719.1 hypothetical protein [Bacillus cereus]
MKEIEIEELIVLFSKISPQKKHGELVADMYDIYEGCQKLEGLIEDMLSDKKDKERLIDDLIEIEIELDHINWHYKSFKKELKTLLIE